MAKKPKETALPPGSTNELKWDPEKKESWLLEFEKEPVNEERWTCLVTAAVQSEVQDDECVQMYRKCVATDLRRAIKVITMADIINLLKGNNYVAKDNRKENKKDNKNENKKEKENKKDKTKMTEKEETKTLQNVSTFSEAKIVELARKYASFTNNECFLHPQLMAALIKHIILNLKKEDIRKKKTKLAMERRIRDYNLRMKFLSSINYDAKEIPEPSVNPRYIAPNILEMHYPIDDEPVGGPDLYIMLIDFFNPLYFTELLNLSVPFLAVFQIAGAPFTAQKSTYSLARPSENVNKNYVSYKRINYVANFWKTINSGTKDSEDPNFFTNILLIEFHTRPLKHAESKMAHNLIFDDLTWLLYSTYTIYRQHQNYLRELSVQRLFLSLETLDLSKCDLYNKLCDALVTGEPNTVLFILYAMIEQVVAGVPFTESIPLEYEMSINDFFKTEEYGESVTDSVDSLVAKKQTLVTPCAECRNKVADNISDICSKLKNVTEDNISIKCAGSDVTQKKSFNYSCRGETSGKSLYSTPPKLRSRTSSFKKYEISETLLDQVLSEKKSEKEIRQEKKWKNPVLNLYGDYVGLDTYHCDKRLIDQSVLFERFLKNLDIAHLWDKYPKLAPEKRAYYNFHFNRLRKRAKQSSDILKIKIFFALCVKLIAITNSEVYQGEDDNISDVFGSVLKERLKKISIRTYQQASSVSKSKANVQSYYRFTRVTVGKTRKETRKTTFSILRENVSEEAEEGVEEEEETIRSLAKETMYHQNAMSHFNLFLTIHRNSNISYNYMIKSSGETPTTSVPSPNQFDEESIKLFNILDSVEISNLPEYHFLANKEEYLEHLNKMKYFETLDPNRMVQRLLQAQEMYNTIQCLYFPPTDTLILIMHNDADYRGMFSTLSYGKLRTPVTLKDFYKYVYPEITDWINNEENEYNKYVHEIKNKELEIEEKKNEHYLSRLAKKYKKLEDEEAIKFIENLQKPLENLEEIDVNLEELPKKYKISPSNRTSFLGVNLANFQVENHKNVQEFFSADGTELNLSIDNWVHDQNKMLTIKVKKSRLKLLYFSWLQQNKMNTDFTLRTASDIIFHFYKTEDDESALKEKKIFPFFYHLKISWPTGLIIESVPHSTTGVYVKQHYIKIYRRDWDIKHEEFRCYLKNGQVLIFKENGSVDILCGSGTIIFLQEFGKKSSENTFNYSTPKYEFVTATGEVWEKPSKGPCRKKKKLVNTYKIYTGTDPITLETYYRRDDGVSFMLWPNGKLVTLFPDGTKITSTPDFDEELIYLDIDHEDEKSVESDKIKKTPVVDNKTAPHLSREEETVVQKQGFVSISFSYLLEHPKYASVSYKTNDKFVWVGMLDNIFVKMHQQGCYKVVQDAQVLNVINDKTEFYTECSHCHEKSIVTLKFEFDSNLCKFVDFFKQTIMITQSGELIFKDEIKKDNPISKSKTQMNNTSKATFSCNHNKSINKKQKCFALERDLSGVELLSSETLANYCHDLSNDCYFDLDVEPSKDSLLSHTFCSPLSKVGYENWVMEYEEQNDTLPTSLKKKDLKEQGKKENLNKLYQHPFPKKHDWDLSANRQVVAKTKVNMPKIIIARTIKTISDEPLNILSDLESYVKVYQKKAHALYDKYKTYKVPKSAAETQNDITSKLRKICMAIDPVACAYPYQLTALPLTEKDIHDKEHKLSFNDILKEHFESESQDLPYCKNIPRTLPKQSNLTDLLEDEDSFPQDA